MAGEVTSFGGYDILYSGASDYSGLCIRVRHDLQPLIAYNDPQGRWMVVQLCIHGEIYEVAAVYASQISAKRAEMWESIAAYPWRSVAFLGGDFNNSPMPRDNTMGRSHMLQIEHKKDHLMAHTRAGDLWVTLQHDMPSYMYHHNEPYNYWARLDRWHLLKTQQFTDFTL